MSTRSAPSKASSSPDARRASAARPRCGSPSRGWTVYATARRPETIADLEAAAAARSRSTSPTRRRWRPRSRAVEAEHGAVGVLVNNAGYSQSGAIETVPMDEVRRQFETNVFGLVRLSQLVLPGDARAALGADRQRLARWAANFTFPGGGFYHATKYAVEAISDALRFEVKGFGVDVVVVQPGLITTEFGDAAATAVGQAEDDGPYDAFNARGRARPRATSTRRARRASSAAAPRRGQDDRARDHRRSRPRSAIA